MINDLIDNREKIIKASFQKCTTGDRKLFQQSSCMMPISVGWTAHEGEKFSTTINLINTCFNNCTISIDDSIQRYTKQIGNQHLGLETLKKEALADGDRWLERNKSIYEQLNIPYKILRWDTWLNHSFFQSVYKKVDHFYQTDDSYGQAIHNSIEEFLKRYIAHACIEKYSYQHAFDNCLDYLKEECSVMCLWAMEGYNFMVHPSDRNQAMKATYEKIIKPSNPGTLRAIGIRFDSVYKPL